MAKKVPMTDHVGKVLTSTKNKKFKILDYIEEEDGYFKIQFLDTENLYMCECKKTLRLTIKDEIEEQELKKSKKKDTLKKRKLLNKNIEIPDIIMVNDKSTKTILAIDQASETSGFCVYKNGKIIDSFSKKFINIDTWKRINIQKKYVEALIEMHKPDYVVLEDIYFHINVHTYKVLASVLAVLTDVCIEKKIEYKILPKVVWANTNIKGKREMQKKKSVSLANKEELVGKKVVSTDDEADAINMAKFFYKDVLCTVGKHLEDFDWN